MFCPVVAEDDGSIAEIFVFGDFADDRGGIIVFPVEGVHIRYKSKEKFLRGG